MASPLCNITRRRDCLYCIELATGEHCKIPVCDTCKEALLAGKTLTAWQPSTKRGHSVGRREESNPWQENAIRSLEDAPGD